MLCIPVERILAAIAKETDAPTAAGLEYLLFRNDWKNSDQFRKISSLPGVAQSIRRAVKATDGEVTVDPAGLSLEPLSTEPAPGTLLDSHIYANRLYCASTEGLFESYLFENHTMPSPQTQLLSLRCADVSAGYGCVNVSTGEEGLWYQPVLFGDRRMFEKPRPFEQVAAVSLGNSYASRHLLNYVGRGAPQFLRADAEKRRMGDYAEYDEWQVRGYQEPRNLRRAAIHALESQGMAVVDEDSDEDSDEHAELDGNFDVLGNSNFRLLVQWSNRLRVLDVAAYEDKDITVRPDKRFERASAIQLGPDEILETYAFGGGFLVESFSDVRLLTETGSHILFEQPAARVRTFSSSRRYQDVAAIVTEDALYLVGFLE